MPTAVSIDSLLNIINSHCYNELSIQSYSGITVYRAIGNDLRPVIEHLRENYKELIKSPVDFFTSFGNNDKYDKSSIIIHMDCYTDAEYEGREVVSMLSKPFDFRYK